MGLKVMRVEVRQLRRRWSPCASSSCTWSSLNWLLGTQLLNANGPVPIGCELLASVAALPSGRSIMVDGAGIMPTWEVSEAGNVTHGVFMVKSG